MYSENQGVFRPVKGDVVEGPANPSHFPEAETEAWGW